MNKKGKLYREAVAEMLKQGKIPPPYMAFGWMPTIIPQKGK